MNHSGDWHKDLPKIDLHRHLEGSVRSTTALEIASSIGLLDVPNSATELDQKTTVQDWPVSSDLFLAKFKFLRKLYINQSTISRIVREAIEDAAVEGVVYLELRFSPAALCSFSNHNMGDVIGWVVQAASRASVANEIEVSLIVSVNRHESIAVAEEAFEATLAYQASIVAVDLAGDEMNFPAAPFASLFRSIAQKGIRVTIHAGEWAGAENVWEAVRDFGATRIGHGVRSIEDTALLTELQEMDVTLEICPSSNRATGVVATDYSGIMRTLLDNQVKFTINTDDPAIFGITIDSEIHTAEHLERISRQEIVQCMEWAVDSAFIENSDREELRNLVLAEWQQAICMT